MKKKLKRNKWLTQKGLGLLKWLGKKIFGHFVWIIIVILALLFGYKIVENLSLKGLLGLKTEQVFRLEKGQRRGVEINFRRKTMRTITRKEDGSEEVVAHNFSGLRRATIIENEDGTISIKAPTIGFIFEPGFSSFFSRGRPHLGLDLEWFYWRRLGLSGGVGFGSKSAGKDDKTLALAAYPLALNYNLPFKLTPNSNVFIGVDDQLQPIIGGSLKW